jgi:drug/metabolite transporter (DMT)-like permease
VSAILLALGSSVGYGISDFLASRVARRLAPVLLVLYSQALQSLVLLMVVVAAGQPFVAAGLGWGAVAGAVGAGALVAYYQALATGKTVIVAPLAASFAVLPVLVDLAGGARLTGLTAGGLVAVLAGIVVTTVAPDAAGKQAPPPPWRGAPPGSRRVTAVLRPRVPVLLALLSALLFGASFVAIDLGAAAAAGGGVLWVAVGVQLGALPPAFLGALASRGRRGLVVADPGLLLPVGTLTVLNLLGDAFLAYAVTTGDLAVVSVLVSLAPVVTIMLAHAVTAERPTALQTAGGALALLGVLAVSANR